MFKCLSIKCVISITPIEIHYIIMNDDYLLTDILYALIEQTCGDNRSNNILEMVIIIYAVHTDHVKLRFLVRKHIYVV